MVRYRKRCRNLRWSRKKQSHSIPFVLLQPFVVKSPYRVFGKILVANRWRVALRVIRACKALGVRTATTPQARGGGAGKGLRVDREPAEPPCAIREATSEASHAFGDGAVFVKKYLARPRHVEIQIFGDARGNVIHLGERECSVQRRH